MEYCGDGRIWTVGRAHCALALELARDRDVLAVGAPGPLAAMLAGAARRVAAIALAGVNRSGHAVPANLVLARASADRLPLADACMDVAMFFGPAGAPDELAALRGEFGRVLRPDGILLILLELPSHAHASSVKSVALSDFERALAGEFHVHAAIRRCVKRVSDCAAGADQPAAPAPGFVILASKSERPPSPGWTLAAQDPELAPLSAGAPRTGLPEVAGAENSGNEARVRELEQRLQRMASDHFHREARLAELERQVAGMERSRSWKLTAPLRYAMRRARSMKKWFFFTSQRLRRKTRKKIEAVAWRQRKLLLFLTGAPTDPGHIYRMERLRKVIPPHYETRLITLEDLWAERAPHLQADIVWIWRAPLEGVALAALREARAGGATIIFDVDDMCFHPDHFTVKNMDALRSLHLNLEEMRQYGARMLNAACLADLRVAPTLPLMQRLFRDTASPSTMMRNTFDHEYRLRCVRERMNFLRAKADDFCRIGYAAGTPTHQADLAPIAPALAAVLGRNPQARLVLFRSIDISEMPALEGVRAQIEMRDIIPLADLPAELARFDINIAPLEAANPFCNCKSELKFFEAALMRVPTIASPTRPFADAIRHGVTGYLAATPEEWEAALSGLLADRRLRDKIGSAAQRSVLWKYGPEYLRRRAAAILDYASADARERARLFNELAAEASLDNAIPQIELTEYDAVFQRGEPTAPVSIVIPLYNYEKYILEALNSALAQTLDGLDIIVVNDCSTDNSQEIAMQWLREHADRFHSVALLRNSRNSGLAVARNVGIDFSESEFILLLDADNQLLPDCASRCLELLADSDAAFAYPSLQAFGEDDYIFSNREWDPMILRHGNYIDALAMIRKACWAAVGGYKGRVGWEDYDLWCKFAERGFWGVNTGAVLANYRVHRKSMRHILTDVHDTRMKLEKEIARSHEWLMLRPGND